MTSLDELKSKWFIDVNLDGQFPPQTRFQSAMVSPYTDGNHLKPLIDGAAMMADFHDQLEMMINSDDPSKWTLYISAMNIHPVKLKGLNHPNKDAMTKILDAAEAGVKVYYMGSGHAGAGQISTSFARKLIARGSEGTGDKRYPPYGGQHQKYTVARGPNNEWVAVLGSGDFFKSNWDTPEHLEENPDRPGSPIHNVWMKIQGPATHDIALSFAERWNDSKTSDRTSPRISSTIPTDFVDNPLPKVGTHSVQLLRIYAIESKPGESYSWADHGEFTIWASYLNAIKRAEKYIYIEDQYLYPFGFKPYFKRSSGTGRDSDIFYQLGEAIKRGVDVICLVPGRNDSIFKHYEFQARRRGADYLRRIWEAHPGAGRFILSKIQVGNKDAVIHSKVMLVDDELALVGSANIAQRSMCLCSEIHLAIIDERNELARDLRLALWSEHMELQDSASILDPRQAVTEYIENARKGRGRLKSLPTTRLKFELPYGPIWDKIIDPYRGPKRI